MIVIKEDYKERAQVTFSIFYNRVVLKVSALSINPISVSLYLILKLNTYTLISSFHNFKLQ